MTESPTYQPPTLATAMTQAPLTLWRFRRSIGWPLAMTGSSAFLLLINPFIPPDEVRRASDFFRLDMPQSLVLGASLAALAIGLWFAKGWAQWVFGFAALVAVTIKGTHAFQHVGDQASWLTVGDALTALFLMFLAVEFLGPNMSRRFAAARELYAAARESRANQVRLELTRAEATVLLDWIWRTEAMRSAQAEVASDQKVLEDLERHLKRKILKADAPNYHLLLAQARHELRVSG